jgi:hypothetical protein
MAEDRTLRRRRKRRRSWSCRRRRRSITRRRRGMTKGMPDTTWMRWWGDVSASGSASSRRYSTSHLVRPPIVTHEDNRVVIIPSGDA